jgi:hypothetical protein
MPFDSSTTPDGEKVAIPDFDKSEIYEREVKPLLNAFHEACMKHEIPMLVLAVIGSKKTGESFFKSDYETEMISCGAWGANKYIPTSLAAARELATEAKLYPFAEQIVNTLCK